MPSSDPSAEVDNLTKLAEQLVERARKGGADVAEATAHTGSQLSVRVRRGEPELVKEAGDRSVGLRVIKEGRVALIATSDLTKAGLDRFIEDALELVELSQPDPFAGPADPELLAKAPFDDVDPYDPKVGEVDGATALAWAIEGEKAALDADKRITNSEGATFARSAGASAIALSSGFSAGYPSSFASLSVTAIADDVNDKKRRGGEWTAKRYLDDLESATAVGKRAAAEAISMLGAKKVDSCQVPVVFHPDAGRAIISLFSSCILGGAIWRKSSYLLDREGTPVASELVRIVDDPLLKRGPGSRPFDGEGLRSRRNVVVEGGVLKTYLCDSYSGRKLDRASTGSAARGGGGGVGPTTTNFMLDAGSLSHDEIIAKTERGLLVTSMMGFGFNAVTGDFSRGASGFWIEDGKVQFPVSEVTVSRNLDELLKDIDLIGSDLDTRSSIVVPTFRVKQMTIAGS